MPVSSDSVQSSSPTRSSASSRSFEPHSGEAAGRSRLSRVWVAESVRLTEEHTGWLDDEQANREARASAGSFAGRLLARAWSLARRDGLLKALASWRQGAVLSVIALAVLAVASGLGLAWAALGDQGNQGMAGQVRVVNVYRALGALLGVNLVMLLVWLLGWGAALLQRQAPNNASSGVVGSYAGRIWMWLCSHLSRDARSWQLGPALAGVLHRERLMPWLLGLFSHGFWLVALAVALGAVLLMLATGHYGFVWESTLLGDGSLVSLTRALGWLPSLLGFPVPPSAAIVASGQIAVDDAGVRQQWALWLVGVIVTYGLLPRLFFLLCCAWGWLRGARRITVDETLPGYKLLRSRLMPAGESLGVSDPAPASLDEEGSSLKAGGAASVVNVSSAGQGVVLFAVELGQDIEWPPELPEGVEGNMHDGGKLDSGPQRQRALDWLQRQPAQRLLAACDARRSPDRGTLRLLVSLAQACGQMRVWLMQANAADADRQRVQDWKEMLSDVGLKVAPDSQGNGGEALAWLERGEDESNSGKEAL